MREHGGAAPSGAGRTRLGPAARRLLRMLKHDLGNRHSMGLQASQHFRIDSPSDLVARN
jgi:hypothetical protein